MKRSLSITQPFLITLGSIYIGLGVLFLVNRQWPSAVPCIAGGVFFFGCSLYLFLKKRRARRAYCALPRECYDPEKHGPWLTSSSW